MVWHLPPTPSNIKVKERVGLYLYSPIWAFMAYSRMNFNLFTCSESRAQERIWKKPEHGL
jgi:hypothetical protein